METDANVLVIYTGGTIGMRDAPGGYVPAPNYLGQQLERMAQFHDASRPRLTMPPSRFGRRVHYDIHEYDPLLDSSNMGMDDWARIAADVGANYDAYDAFVVLHGTDTMAYTASALSFMLENLKKTVILTGSQIPLTQLRNDAIGNLLGALTIAGHYEIPEVCLYFCNKLLRGNRSQKLDASGFDAFGSTNHQALVDVGIDIAVHWNVLCAPSEGAFRVQTSMSRNVAALRLFPGITPEILGNFLRPPLQGLVMETFGSGNAPDRDRALLDALEAASERGVVIVNCTQCLKGTVSGAYATGRALADAGVVPGADMTPEAALTKLSYLLGQGLEPAEVRAQMQRNLRGEMTVTEEEPRFSFREQRFVRSVARALSEMDASATGAESGIEQALFPVLLCAAAGMGDLDQVRRLVDSGADVNAGDYDGRTALHLAASEGHVAVAAFLLDRGAHVSPRDRWGGTPTVDALRHEHADVVTLLAARGAT